MNPELPSLEQDGKVSPHAREVEYALILSRMIDIVKEILPDPLGDLRVCPRQNEARHVVGRRG
jgi:hypothetical protein